VVRLTNNAESNQVKLVHSRRRLAAAVNVCCCPVVRKIVYYLITITVLCASHAHLAAQEVTSEATPATSLPEAPGGVGYPTAVVLPAPGGGVTATVTSSGPQSKTGNVLAADGDVVVVYVDRRVEADHIEYDTETGELTATGHLKVSGGRNHENISASHATLNLQTETGQLYDVSGSVGVKRTASNKIYTDGDAFIFTGRMVVKNGPEDYDVFDGTVTSCQMAKPDWLLSADRISVKDDKARASKSVFRLMNVPLLFLPYVTQPVNSKQRQSGILIPVISNSSTKGIVLGEEVYWAINRSTDLTAGTEYFSSRGWSPSAGFRYRGNGNDFAKAKFRALFDRGYYSDGVYTNQGGQDVTFVGRHDFSEQTRVAADMEYLSSYVYREAFTSNFNQAVSTDILSIAYAVHEANGYSIVAGADRYQGLKQIPTSTTPGEQVRIFHVPAVEVSTTDHELGTTGLQWSFDTSADGLKRVQPSFATGGITERIDLHPQLSYTLAGWGWFARSSLGLRDTFYSRSRIPSNSIGGPPIESDDTLNRADVEVNLDIRPPVIERTFTSKFVEKFFRGDVKHTIEPEVTYRYVNGISNFLNVLRFDDVDVAADTNELEYGVTQRLFRRARRTKPCTIVRPDLAPPAEKQDDEETPDLTSGCGPRQWISWRLTQKYFYDQLFGGAVVRGRRNVFDTTLNLSGIAFLTEPRAISPLISRLKMRLSDKTDFEWDFDLDTGAKKFTSNNFIADVHEGNVFGGLSYARLNAPGRSYVEGVTSAVADFSQLRVLMGYGGPTKLGLGLAASANLDLKQSSLQYGALQGSYNWDCCGFSVEYRKYELGSVRNESVERFSFTLKNIGTAGNLKRADRLY
jgi:LPS-assembly protein